MATSDQPEGGGTGLAKYTKSVKDRPAAVCFQLEGGDAARLLLGTLRDRITEALDQDG